MSAERWLVVNADDLGLSDGVNAGIMRAHAHGVVTTASLMVHGPAAERAVAAAADHPRLALGLHVDLAEWVCEHGRWRARYQRVDAGDADAVRAELEDQLDRFRALTGRDPSHLDSHQHVHRDEPVRSIMGVRARELGVPLRHHGRARYCGAFYGQGHDGAALPEAITAAALVALVDALPPGVTELCCHPAAAAPAGTGYGAERLRELAALCDPAVRAAIATGGVRVGTFAEALAATAPPSSSGRV
jgi:predicted glycoside hydrolase/deacetylase ChbG (UPF0249 family)